MWSAAVSFIEAHGLVSLAGFLLLAFFLVAKLRGKGGQAPMIAGLTAPSGTAAAAPKPPALRILTTDTALLRKKEALPFGKHYIMGAGAPPAKSAFRSALGYATDKHLLTIAPTRSGKGRGVILPNLLDLPEHSVSAKRD